MMLKIDWASFGANIRAQAVVDAKHYATVERELGISHARLINAAQGKPVGTEIYLTLCAWMAIDPLFFARDSGSDRNGGDGEAAPGEASQNGPQGIAPNSRPIIQGSIR